MKNTVEKIFWGAMLLLVLVLIYSASFQSGTQSGNLSAAVVKVINGGFKKLGLGLRISELFLRKAAHFSEYAALGILLYNNRRVWKSSLRIDFAWLLFLGLLFPVLDEFLQYFRPGRGSMVPDVLLDFLGFLFGVGLCALCGLIYRRLRRDKSEEDDYIII